MSKPKPLPDLPPNWWCEGQDELPLDPDTDPDTNPDTTDKPEQTDEQDRS